MSNTQERPLVVVPYRPWLKWIWGATATIAVSLAFGGGYWYSMEQRQQQFVAQQASSEGDASRAALELERELAALRLQHTVDETARHKSHDDMVQLQRDIEELNEQLAFYKGMMEPNASDPEISFTRIRVTPLAAGQVKMMLIAQQRAAQHVMLKGQMSLNLIGQQGEQVVTLSLAELLPEQDKKQDKLPLQFRYFQELELVLTLPEGFEAVTLQLAAEFSGKKKRSVDQQFSWTDLVR